MCTRRLASVQRFSSGGVPGFEAVTWYGLYGPGKLPREIVDRVNAGFKKALDSTDVKARLTTLGVDTVASTPEYLKKYLDEELVKWADVVKRSGMKVE
jgi:tripartite-type tricarboxylate transporter receptor subunit TctC